LVSTGGGGDDDDGGGGDDNNVGGHRGQTQNSTKIGSGRNGGDGNGDGNDDWQKKQIKVAVKEMAAAAQMCQGGIGR